MPASPGAGDARTLLEDMTAPARAIAIKVARRRLNISAYSAPEPTARSPEVRALLDHDLSQRVTVPLQRRKRRIGGCDVLQRPEPDAMQIPPSGGNRIDPRLTELRKRSAQSNRVLPLRKSSRLDEQV